MRTEAEWKNLEAERDALILAVADHVTVRAEQYGRIQELSEALAEWKASAYRSQTDCSVAASTIQQLSDERYALAARVQEMRDRLDYTLAYIEERDDWEGREAIIADVSNELATPDTSAKILARRDAAIWLEAADVCVAIRNGGDWTGGDEVYALRAKADELLKDEPWKDQ